MTPDERQEIEDLKARLKFIRLYLGNLSEIIGTKHPEDAQDLAAEPEVMKRSGYAGLGSGAKPVSPSGAQSLDPLVTYFSKRLLFSMS